MLGEPTNSVLPSGLQMISDSGSTVSTRGRVAVSLNQKHNKQTTAASDWNRLAIIRPHSINAHGMA